MTNHSPPPGHVTPPSSLIGSDLAATVLHLQLLVGHLVTPLAAPLVVHSVASFMVSLVLPLVASWNWGRTMERPTDRPQFS